MTRYPSGVDLIKFQATKYSYHNNGEPVPMILNVKIYRCLSTVLVTSTQMNHIQKLSKLAFLIFRLTCFYKS